MSTTTDLGLRKPASNEFFNIADLTDNLDILNELLKARIEKNKVVNNLTTTEEGFIADARALKTLSDSIDSLNESLSQLNNNLINNGLPTHVVVNSELSTNKAWLFNHGDGVVSISNEFENGNIVRLQLEPNGRIVRYTKFNNIEKYTIMLEAVNIDQADE